MPTLDPETVISNTDRGLLLSFTSEDGTETMVELDRDSSVGFENSAGQQIRVELYETVLTSVKHQRLSLTS